LALALLELTDALLALRCARGDEGLLPESPQGKEGILIMAPHLHVLLLSSAVVGMQDVRAAMQQTALQHVLQADPAFSRYDLGFGVAFVACLL
jgi:hypothetical protein